MKQLSYNELVRQFKHVRTICTELDKAMHDLIRGDVLEDPLADDDVSDIKMEPEVAASKEELAGWNNICTMNEPEQCCDSPNMQNEPAPKWTYTESPILDPLLDGLLGVTRVDKSKSNDSYSGLDRIKHKLSIG